MGVTCIVKAKSHCIILQLGIFTNNSIHLHLELLEHHARCSEQWYFGTCQNSLQYSITHNIYSAVCYQVPAFLSKNFGSWIPLSINLSQKTKRKHKTMWNSAKCWYLWPNTSLINQLAGRLYKNSAESGSHHVNISIIPHQLPWGNATIFMLWLTGD